MHQRPALLRGATLLAVIGLVAGACTSGSTPSPAASSAPPASTPAASAPAAETPAASASSGGEQIGGKVTVIGTWGGSEQESFLAMVKPFEDQTGIKVEYTGTRDLNAVLTTGVASGILPDLAGLPGPGQMKEYAQAGALKPLDDVLDLNTYKAETAPALVDLGTVDGKISAVFIKAAVKGLIWYNPKVYTAGPATTWDDLESKAKAAASSVGGSTTPWCTGIESGAASGWPGTDWIEDFVLRQSGPDVYDAWVNGTQKWTSAEIKQAWQAFGQVVSESYGGGKTVNATNFGDAGNPLFKTPPGCIFLHQASFITDFFKKQGGAKDGEFDFFPMPDINSQFSGAVEGAGDLFGMFNDTPQARALMKYLVTADAQDIWVKLGGALSANKNAIDYPDDTSKRSAEILANAKIFRFDASDLMPQAMNDAFWKGIVDYVKDPNKLDSILSNLDSVQSSAYGG
ncbi:MAG TPA: extracellular solute-binding protein [Candidatus Limnocylindrales bacterium]